MIRTNLQLFTQLIKCTCCFFPCWLLAYHHSTLFLWRRAWGTFSQRCIDRKLHRTHGGPSQPQLGYIFAPCRLEMPHCQQWERPQKGTGMRNSFLVKIENEEVKWGRCADSEGRIKTDCVCSLFLRATLKLDQAKKVGLEHRPSTHPQHRPGQAVRWGHY